MDSRRQVLVLAIADVVLGVQTVVGRVWLHAVLKRTTYILFRGRHIILNSYLEGRAVQVVAAVWGPRVRFLDELTDAEHGGEEDAVLHHPFQVRLELEKETSVYDKNRQGKESETAKGQR